MAAPTTAETPAIQPELSIATMNEWWRLTGRYPDFRRMSHALLKEFGYMRLMDLFDVRKPARALEFGHGFNPTLLQHAQPMCEMHAIDDDMQLPYFPTGQEWEALYDEHIRSACTDCHLHRGLLGGEHDLEPGAFDLVASVSVLEELDPDDLDRVVADAANLLAPGGLLAGTFDIMLSWPAHIERLRDACGRAGLILPAPEDDFENPDWNALLLESPSCVMTIYQMNQSEPRQFSGHWSAVWFVAEKPA
jgi:SAM-dependent methyltransferase